MRRSQLALIFAFFLFALPKLHAQQPPTQTTSATIPQTPGQDVQSMAVLRSTLTALGAQAVASIKDTAIQGTTTPPPNLSTTPGTSTIRTKGAYMIRTDGGYGSRNSIVIFNHGREFRQLGKGWVQAPAGNAYQKRFEHLP